MSSFSRQGNDSVTYQQGDSWGRTFFKVTVGDEVTVGDVHFLSSFSRQGNDSVTYQYTYTPRNEVATVTTNGTTYSYNYNASSLRTSKTVDGVTTNFIWAGSNIIREETPDKATDYFYGINRVSRHVTGDAYTYTINEITYDDEGNRITTTIPVNGYHEFYAYDGRGNVVHTMAIDSVDLYIKPFFGSAAPFPEIDINADGLADLTDINMLSSTYPIVQNYYYSPFGEVWQGEKPNDTNPFRYAGEYLDAETGDIYLRARYYDPSIGRFITVDPIKDGTNWYVYCGNNPIMFVDPSGTSAVHILNSISEAYNKGNLTAAGASNSIILHNGFNVWTALHEIAQINIAKELYDMGLSPELERPIYYTEDGIFGEQTHCVEADIVCNSFVWEVKPLGKSGEKQLNLYTEKGNFYRGYMLQPIDNIPVIGDIKMEITFPSAGMAHYSFYTVDSEGEKVSVPSTSVKALIISYVSSYKIQETIKSLQVHYEQIQEDPMPYVIALLAAGAATARYLMSGGMA